jgi:hypothetical protein
VIHQRRFFPVLAGLIFGVTGLASGQRPHEAIIYDDEARFVFPVPDRPGWLCDGPRGTLQYGWEVETLTSEGVLRFGFMAWGFRSRPDTLTFSEIVESCGQVGVWRPDGVGWRVISGLKVHVAAIETAAGEERLVVQVTDPATLMLLFPPAAVQVEMGRVVFTTKGFRLEDTSIKIPLFFHRGPAPPLPSVNPPTIRQTR